jgi:chemotaxis protein MotB
MAGRGGKKDSRGGVIIKKYTTEAGGHHGGAWKVAYADFVTAMMAFFLLMWLLNATTEEQRKGLADYFSPNNLMSRASSGTGDPFGGHTAFDSGALVSDRGAAQVIEGRHPIPENVEDGDDPVATSYHRAKAGEGVGIGPAPDDQDADDEPAARSVGQPGVRQAAGTAGAAAVSPGQAGGDRQAAADAAALQEQARQQQARAEKAGFEQAAAQIRQAVAADPALSVLAHQLAVDMTPDGLRIQILDEVKLPMFPSGSASPNERARLLIQKVTPMLMKLDHPIAIAGHTDAQPFPGPDRTNWELSAERANATRRLLTDSGFPDARIRSVSGEADRDPLLPSDPLAPANRRVAILVLREAPSPVTRQGSSDATRPAPARDQGRPAPAFDASRPAPVDASHPTPAGR